MTHSQRLMAGLAVGWCSLALGVKSAPAQRPAAPLWQSDLKNAQQLARRLKRPLLIHFFAGWCRPCRLMEREAFSSRQFRRRMTGKFVLVKVNADRHPELVKKYGVTGLPTDVLVSPTGTVLSRSAGYDSQKKYLARLAQWDSRYVTKARLHSVGNRPPATNSLRKQSVKPPSTGSTRKSPERASLPGIRLPRRRPVIGMDGYSPVAMHRQQKWIAGKPQFAWRYQGVVYWLADESEWRDFKAAPKKFAPRLLGCDPVVLAETDRAVRGKVQFGALFDGSLYFFVSAASRTKFRAKPSFYANTRHVLRVDEIHGTVRR